MIDSLRGFICGRTGTGKSTRAWHLYLKNAPRVLLLDQTGEWQSLADRTCYTVRDAVEAIRAYAPRGEWVITLALDPAELPQLVDWLIPVPDITSSPVLKLGGMWLLVDEVDLVAPLGPPPEHIRTLYRRSRHAGLSVLSLSQRPENVCREVTALSSHIIALSLTEPRAHDYVRRIMGWNREDVAAWIRWTRLHPHGGCWKDVHSGRILWLPEAGNPTERGPSVQLPLPLAPRASERLPLSAPQSAPASPSEPSEHRRESRPSVSGENTSDAGAADHPSASARASGARLRLAP